MARSFSLDGCTAAHLERQPNGRSFFAGRYQASSWGEVRKAKDLLTLAARAEEGLGLIDKPAWAHADNPMPG